MQVALFFLPSSLGGGSTSFTAHLYKGLEMAGHEPLIFRIRARHETNGRPFGKYGIPYQNVTLDASLKMLKHTPGLLTGPTHSKHLPFAPDAVAKLMKAGMRIVVHDPNEFKVFDHLTLLPRNAPRPIIIRPPMRQFFPKALFIPHPYVRQRERTNYKPEKRLYTAVSIARITFVKRTHLILEANRLVSEEQQCILRGAENRLYTRHVLTKKFPEFKQGKYGFPMTFVDAVKECANAKYAVDFTYFPDDGGGSQYSFMEAWDAGTVNVIHSDWLRFDGEMKAEPWSRYPGERGAHPNPKRNCIAVDDASQLAALLKNEAELSRHQRIVENGYAMLKAEHDPARIAKRYVKELTR